MGAQVPNGRSKVVVGAMAVTVVAAAAIFGYSYFSARQETGGRAGSGPTSAAVAPGSPTPAPTASPPPVLSSVVVFQPSITATSTTTSIVALDGSVKRSFTSRAADATFAPAYSQSGLTLLEGSTLLTVDKSWSIFRVLAPDGTAAPVAASLGTLLGGIAHPTAVSLSNGITLGRSTLLALESSPGSDDVQFVKIDLAGGTTTTLLTAHPTTPGLPHLRMLPASVSPDGEKVYLLAGSVTINATAVSGVSLVTLDLTTGGFASKPLQASIDPSLAAVSSDGSLIGYQVESANNGYASWTTHIYHVDTASDTTVQGESITPPEGSNGIRFSPDGAYLFEAGYYAADTKKAGMALRVISVSSAATAHQIDLPGVQSQLQSFGWAGDHAIIYTTNSSTTGNFDSTIEATHSLDPATGSVFDFPRGLGELVGVLNYQV